MRWVLLTFLQAAPAVRPPIPAALPSKPSGEQDDEALALIPARGGGLYVGGYTGGTLGVSNLGPAGDSRGFVRHLDGASPTP